MSQCPYDLLHCTAKSDCHADIIQSTFDWASLPCAYVTEMCKNSMMTYKDNNAKRKEVQMCHLLLLSCSCEAHCRFSHSNLTSWNVDSVAMGTG